VLDKDTTARSRCGGDECRFSRKNLDAANRDNAVLEKSAGGLLVVCKWMGRERSSGICYTIELLGYFTDE
jgi:hypothetical protein